MRNAEFCYEEANESFKCVRSSDFSLYSVLLRAYINICIWDCGDDYLDELYCYEKNAIALYMIALHFYVKSNDFDRVEFFNERSLKCSAFPANLILKAQSYGFHHRVQLMSMVNGLVKNKRCEDMASYKNIGLSAIFLYKELILKDYFTSVNWASLQQELA